MSSSETDGGRNGPLSGIERLKQEVVVLEARLSGLEQENSRSVALFQVLGKALGFGAAGKLEWARFKLKFKQEELSQLEAQRHLPEAAAGSTASSTRPQPAPSADPAGETTRQKMERMVKENPAELTSHIRLVYRRLIEAENSAVR
ncbi:MAG TPA: hypothetical protein VFD58_25140 [Blastocatellia bacterium]|nr:hypothetical protein [Blastocatellia bacterium]